jgi:acyl-CoA synthetase (AMP-forming)/AMP-acid ligase II
MSSWRQSEVADLLARRAGERGGDVAFVDARSGRTRTWRAVAATAECWANQRWALARNNGRVGLLAAEALHAAESVLAALAAGVTVAPLDPGAPPAELGRTVRSLGLTSVVTDVDDDVEGSLAGAGVDIWRTGAGSLQRSACRLGPPPPSSGLDAALVMTSSGTTGAPKIVPLGDDQLLHAARAVAAHHRLSPDDAGYCPLPLFHINAIVVGVLATLVGGGRLVVDRFSRQAFWERAARHRVTWVNLVPAILAILADAPPPPPDVAARIRFARSASAPLATATQMRFERRCGIPVLETYGMTEAASQITANPLPAADHRRGSVGRPVGIELRIVDDGGRRVETDAVGRVEVRGDSVVSSYWSEAEGGLAAQPATNRCGWLATGDLGRIDGDGYLYLMGRDDDVINRGGEKIYPREIEEVLLADRRVRAAVVVGRPHPIVGEEPVAFVVAAAGSERGDLAGDLSARCRCDLSPFKRPAEITVAASLPAGPTGKVRRGELRRLMAEAGVAS